MRGFHQWLVDFPHKWPVMPVFHSIISHAFHNYQHTSCLLNVMIIFGRFCHSFAAMPLAKYEHYSKNLLNTFVKSEISLMEKWMNAAVINPTYRECWDGTKLTVMQLLKFSCWILFISVWVGVYFVCLHLMCLWLLTQCVLLQGTIYSIGVHQEMH